ncbi:MAG: L-2-amino-thiazoline-4-carboxylic acid hydrolase [Chloroflexota bacterium]
MIRLQEREVIAVQLPAARRMARALAELPQLNGGSLMPAIRQHYHYLFALRPAFSTNAVSRHVEQHILPALALYRSLQDAGYASAEARTLVGDYLEIRARLDNQFVMTLLKRLPFAYAIFRRLLRYRMTHSFGEPGFSMDWIEDNQRCITFNITRCLYLSVLSAFDVPELTQAFCRTDHVRFGLMAPLVTFERSGTLATGCTVCDFRFSRRNPAAKGPTG